MERGMKMRAKRGFTLVEILIVVVILGILAAIVIPQFTDASTEAKTSAVKSNLQTMRSQVELYKIKNDDDPPATLAALVSGGYMQAVPDEPFGNAWDYNSTTGVVTSTTTTPVDCTGF